MKYKYTPIKTEWQEVDIDDKIDEPIFKKLLEHPEHHHYKNCKIYHRNPKHHFDIRDEFRNSGKVRGNLITSNQDDILQITKKNNFKNPNLHLFISKTTISNVNDIISINLYYCNDCKIYALSNRQSIPYFVMNRFCRNYHPLTRQDRNIIGKLLMPEKIEQMKKVIGIDEDEFSHIRKVYSQC